MTVRPRPTLIVPDEATWTMAGHDPAASGLVPAASAEAAGALLAPARVPEPLEAVVVGEWRRSSGLDLVAADPCPLLRGRPLREVIADHADERHASAEEHAGHEGHDVHGGDGPHGGHEARTEPDHQDGHGGHDHHDMMAIVGEPSADGLVMEPIDFRFGPLTTLLPGGLIVEVSLDGDVVAIGRVHATLRSGVDGPADVPDPLTPVAWGVAQAVSHELAAGSAPPARVQWERLAALELERALSHLAWARSLGRVLGWAQLIERAQRAVQELAPLHRLPAPSLEAVAEIESVSVPVAKMVEGRRFAARTRGRGRVVDDALAGPNARAAGSSADTRLDDPLYVELGFAAATEEGGDAYARALVRIRETQASLRLAALALERARAVAGPGTLHAFATVAGARVEGPRGPVLVRYDGPDGSALRTALGADAALAAAGEAIAGLEWSAALVVLSSFDLSSWAVGG